MYTIYPFKFRKLYPSFTESASRFYKRCKQNKLCKSQIKKSVNMAESSEKMPPYPDIFTDDFQVSDQAKYDI